MEDWNINLFKVIGRGKEPFFHFRYGPSPRSETLDDREIINSQLQALRVNFSFVSFLFSLMLLNQSCFCSGERLSLFFFHISFFVVVVVVVFASLAFAALNYTLFFSLFVLSFCHL